MDKTGSEVDELGDGGSFVSSKADDVAVYGDKMSPPSHSKGLDEHGRSLSRQPQNSETLATQELGKMRLGARKVEDTAAFADSSTGATKSGPFERSISIGNLREHSYVTSNTKVVDAEELMSSNSDLFGSVMGPGSDSDESD